MFCRLKVRSYVLAANVAGTLKVAPLLATYTQKHYGVPLCAECAQKRKDAATAAAASQEEQPAPPEETVAETEEVL